MAFITITARFRGVCKRCGGSIQPGQRIRWNKGKKGMTYHLSAQCDGSEEQPADSERNPPNEYGNDGYQQWNEEAQRIRLAESGQYDEPPDPYDDDPGF